MMVDAHRGRARAAGRGARRARAPSSKRRAPTCAGAARRAVPAVRLAATRRARFLDAGAEAPLPTTWSDEIEARRPDLAALAAAAARRGRAGRRSPSARRFPTSPCASATPTTRSSPPENQRQSLGARHADAAAGRRPRPGRPARRRAPPCCSARRARAALDRRPAKLTLAAAVRAARAHRRPLAAARQRRSPRPTSCARRWRARRAQGGASQVDVLLARRRYQELLLEAPSSTATPTTPR